MPTWGKSIPWKGRSNVTNAILPLLWKRIWQNISAKVMAKKSSNAINVIMLQVEDQIFVRNFWKFEKLEQTLIWSIYSELRTALNAHYKIHLKEFQCDLCDFRASSKPSCRMGPRYGWCDNGSQTSLLLGRLSKMSDFQNPVFWLILSVKWYLID